LGSNEAFQDLVAYIVRSLVDEPDAVSVTEVEGKNAIVIEVSVAEGDKGRIIGKSGSVINSIRTLLQVLAAKRGKRVTLEII
jgi:predicted RNA-binding protein YlqC (UPF0109 family)